jgi:RHS repeat-associated protein
MTLAGRGAGIEPPAISLPRGGGAIRGIGEKFTANPVTGTGSLRVPLATSPGRSGFGPQLSLSCDTGSGNGLFGFGWGLGVPSVTRKTEKGLPRYIDDGAGADVFILSGAEDLVPSLVEHDGKWEEPDAPQRTLSDGSTWRVRRYRPRTEGLFARIERWTNARTRETHWRSISRDNVTTLYGTSDESRVADPADPLRVFSWLICESYDNKGNAIVYRYKPEDSTGVDSGTAHERNRSDETRSANRYIKRIQYTNRTPRNAGENLMLRTDWLFEVVFDYGEHDRQRPTPGDSGDWLCRHDPFSSYRAGFELRTYRLCQRVLMFHHFPRQPDVGRDCLVRSTDFAYRSNRGQPEDVRRGHPIASFIAAVTQTGYRRDGGGYLKRSLPPLEFEYSEATIHDELQEVDPKSVENLPEGVDGTQYQWADLDGEGLQGVLTRQGNVWYYKRNVSAERDGGDGRARFDPLELVGQMPAAATLGERNQQLLDLAGDGTMDFVGLGGPLPGFHERTDEEAWSPFTPFESLPNLAWDDANLRFADLTGDGRADVLITDDDALTWYSSLGEQGFGRAERVTHPIDEESGPRLVFADGTQSIFLADASGDGLPDLVRIRNGEACYWPNLGYGRFGTKVTMDNAPWFDAPDLFDPARIRLGDSDGSGNADIFYLRPDRAQLYLNHSGNSWSSPHHLGGFPTDDLSSVTVVDLLGLGTACLVSSSPLPADADRPMRYIDLMGGVKPHLIVGIRNNLGAETRVQYAPSTRYYLDDRRAGRPWVTRLPFPVHVVARVETVDRVGRARFVSSYAYHHGHFDGAEREFCGFGMVERLDSEWIDALGGDAAPDAAPVLTRMWFHTGAFLGREHVSNFFAGLLDGRDVGEYYREPGLDDAAARAQLLDDTILPAGLTAEEEREACRALRGSLLREEVYGLDGSSQQAHPYTVLEQSFGIRVLQRRAGNSRGVFLAHPRESLIYHYERRPDDPRVGHALTFEVDEYGNVLRSAAIAYGRRRPDTELAAADQQVQARLQVTYNEHRFTNAADADDAFRAPQPCEACTFEVTGLVATGRSRLSLGEVEDAAANATVIPYEQAGAPAARQKRLIEHARTLYRRDDLDGPLALGELQSLGLLFESYKLALTPSLVADVYGDRVTNGMLAGPCRYVHTQGDANWWIPSGRLFYSPGSADPPAQELAYARAHFFLAHRFRDAFHAGDAPTERFAAYDDYDLLVRETRDALGNRITVGERDADPRRPLARDGHDYRVLQPILIMDPNRNRSACAFDALGMVTATAVMGKPEEAPTPGDSLAGVDADPPPEVIGSFFADPKGAATADLLGSASTRIVYDVNAYRRRADTSDAPPVWTATLARETHSSEPVPADGLRIQVAITYSDGFGRDIQLKGQAEAGPVSRRDPAGRILLDRDGRPLLTATDTKPRWIGSGWRVLDGKGRTIRHYEAFFTDRHAFEFDLRIGVSPVIFYDPLGRVAGTLHPDRTWEKATFDAWRQTTWDVSDTVLVADPRTDADVGDFFRRLPESEFLPTWHAQRSAPGATAADADAAQKAAVHASTPSVQHMDALGRTFLKVAHNAFKYGDADPRDPRTEERHLTRVMFDIEGNARQVIDARDRVVARCSYDMLGTRIHHASMEAGERWTLYDVAGLPAYAWDARGHELHTSYDALRRETDTVLRAGVNQSWLIERTVYGDSRRAPVPESANLRGKVVAVYDQAGVVVTDDYDFKGNLRVSSRRLAADFRRTLDWAGSVALEERTYSTRSEFDALNRVTEMEAADGTVFRRRYNEASLPDRLEVNLRGVRRAGDRVWTAFVLDAAYDAEGRRIQIEYGSGAAAGVSGVTTKLTYDPRSSRLTRLVTRRDPGAFPADCPDPQPAGWPGCRLQDLEYTYDAAGNVTQVIDRAQQQLFFRNRRVAPDAEYTYDALNRLIEASGRHHVAGGASTSYNDRQRVGLPWSRRDGTALGRYTERFFYDMVGNVREHRLRTGDGRAPGWTRRFEYEEASRLEPGRRSNRLTRLRIGADTQVFSDRGDGYDAHGNMLRMPHLKELTWDFHDQLRMTRRQAVDASDAKGIEHAGERTWYVYDTGGRRIRVVTETADGAVIDDRIFVEAFELHRRPSLTRETVRVSEGAELLALVETRTQGAGRGPRQLTRYQLANRLGSAVIELNQRAAVLSYEEYYPYGATSYQASRAILDAGKRYRFTGKERDEASGLYAHGARYYAPWLARWTSCDPIGMVDGTNRYAYARCNPVRLHDPVGREVMEPLPPGPSPYPFDKFPSEPPTTPGVPGTPRGPPDGSWRDPGVRPPVEPETPRLPPALWPFIELAAGAALVAFIFYGAGRFGDTMHRRSFERLIEAEERRRAPEFKLPGAALSKVPLEAPAHERAAPRIAPRRPEAPLKIEAPAHGTTGTPATPVTEPEKPQPIQVAPYLDQLDPQALQNIRDTLKDEKRFRILQKVIHEIETGAALGIGVAQADKVLGTSGRLGTAAHSILEKFIAEAGVNYVAVKYFNEVLTKVGSGFYIIPEYFVDKFGTQVPRRAEGSLGIDVMIFFRGKPLLGVDLKTGRGYSAPDRRELEKRLGAPVIQIGPRF